MSHAERPYAGMILPDSQDMDPTPYLSAAQMVLMRLERASPRRRSENTITGRVLGIRVTPEEVSDFGPRMLLEVVNAVGGTPTEDQDEDAARLLSDTVLQSLDHSQADILEWYSPDVLLDVEDFVRLRSYVSPRRHLPQHMQDAPDVDHIANDERSRLMPVEKDEIDFAAIPAVGQPKRPYRPRPHPAEPVVVTKPQRRGFSPFGFLSRNRTPATLAG